MFRIQLENLVLWRNKKSRKPIIINGARQVGKTWLLKEFGRLHFKNVAYINFESSPTISAVLEQGFNIESILIAIQIETGIQPIAGETLIIFDEIQLAPKAITCLKYFYENAKSYHIACAGSLLGVAMANASSFPVGKVEFLDLYPIRFPEFVNILNEKELFKILQENNWEMINVFKNKLQELLRLYYYIGGMPEAVASYLETQSLSEVRQIQNNVLRTYELDFSKHAPINIVPRIRMLWQNIPAQLAKENKKFLYKAVKEGSRAKDYELALHWLIDAGLVHKVCNISTATLPLKVYENTDSFKLFLLDVGLLGAMVNVDADLLLQHNFTLVQYKGALTEQYVMQQLLPETKLYYWSASTTQAEVDFVIEANKNVWPLEVKAEENLKAKSLAVYYKKFNPAFAIRISMSNYRKDEWMVNVPLVGISGLMKMISENK
jgi:uncharacterized protein